MEYYSAFEKKDILGVPAVVQWVKNSTAVARITAVAQIQSLARELPYAVGAAIKEKKEKKKKKKGHSDTCHNTDDS